MTSSPTRPTRVDTAAERTNPTRTTQIMRINRLRWMRRLWVLVFAFNLIYGLLNLVIYTVLRLTPCQTEPCLPFLVSASAAEEYARAGVPFAVAALMRPLIELLLVTVYTGVGVLIFRRRSDDRMGLLVSLMLPLLGFQLTYSIETLQALDAGFQWVSMPLTLAMLVTTYSALYLLPNGRFDPRWAKWLLVLSLAIELPRGVLSNLVLTGVDLGYILILALMASSIGLGLQVRRYRRLPQIERQQMKWLIFAGVLLVGGLALSAVQRVVIPSLTGTAFVVGGLLALLSQFVLYMGLPIAFTFSLLRYRLWDADLVINRALVYTVSAGMLGVVGLGGFFVFSALLTGLVGSESGWPTVLAGMLMLLVSVPLRRWVGGLIDQYVYGLRVGLHEADKHISSHVPPPVNPALPGRYSGQRVGQYQIGQLLGRGAMSEVYSAQDSLSGKTVAMKLLRPELSVQQVPRMRFQREADALRRIVHPNVVSLVASGMAEGQYYLAMELLNHRTLADRMGQLIPILYADALRIIRDVAQALDAVHGAGFVHRDVKPANVLLRQTDDGVHAVLTDFGVVKSAGDEVVVTGGGDFVGTLNYVAPEQIRTTKDIDHRADIYALGVIAYQLLAGRHPFDASAAAMVFAHLNQPPTDPRVYNSGLSALQAFALVKALSKRPEDRYDSAGMFADALRA